MPTRLRLFPLLAVLISACTSTAIPPTAADLSKLQTAQIETQNAPPPEFQRPVQFARIDDRLDQQTSYQYKVTLSFDGTFVDSTEKVSGAITAEVYSSQTGIERRVVLQTTGDVFGANTPRYLEGVRIGNNFYRVDASKTCTDVSTEEAGRTLAELSAGALIGGVRNASFATTRRISNQLGGIPIWEYSFSPDDIIPPTVQLEPTGTITIASGTLWIAPAVNAAAEYQITLNVVNGRIQGSQPVTGQLRAEYALIETGVAYNIAIPYGC